MHALFPAFHDARRHQRRQAAQPETRCLRLAVPVLPRLHDAIRPAEVAGEDGNRVFDSHARHLAGVALHGEPERVRLFVAAILEPARAGDCQRGAWRVRNEQIPLPPPL